MEDGLKYLSVIHLSLLFISCSQIEKFKKSFKKDSQEENSPQHQMVSQVQYEQLLAKYEELENNYLKLKNNSSVHESLNKNINSKDAQQSSNHFLSKNSSSLETVDVFQDDLFNPEDKSQKNSSILIPPQIKLQIQIFRRAVSLLKDDQEEAIKIFQQLELKAIHPIKVRAKYELAQIFETKGQYDLALQIYEDIIHEHASSGVVLWALEGAVKLSEKLGIMNKRDLYGSMLKDIFEEKI